MRAVLLTFDRLPVHALGCYGNLEAQTPSFDRLAAKTVVFDSHFTESVVLPQCRSAWWTGCSAFPRADCEQSTPTLPAVLRDHGVHVRLIHTPGDVAGVPVHDFSETVPLETGEAAAASFEFLIEAALDQLEQLPKSEPWLLWVHCTDDEGTGTNTDAIQEFDAGLGQLDAGLGRIAAAEEVLFVVTAALGQQSAAVAQLPQQSTNLCEPLAHTPLLVQLGATDLGSRRRSFTQTIDLAPTLLEWFEVPPAVLPCDGRSWLPAVRDGLELDRPYICYGDGQGGVAIRTEDYCVAVDDLEAVIAAESTAALGPEVRLYLKPDDYWEVDEAHAQYPDQATELMGVLRQFVENARAQAPMDPPDLPEGGRFPEGGNT